MKNISTILLVILVLITASYIIFTNIESSQQTDSSFPELALDSGEIKQIDTKTDTRYGIEDVTYLYDLTKNNEVIGELTLVQRIFSTGDKMYFAEINSNAEVSLNISLTEDPEELTYETLDKTVEEVYPFRKDRTLTDPLTNKLTYLETRDHSFLLGSQISFQDISEVEPSDGSMSHVLELLTADHSIATDDELSIKLKTDEKAHTWWMVSEDELFKNPDDFEEAYNIGIDEFRWITKDMLYSHGLNSIFPSSEDAFVNSLVRQSGRASSIKLMNEPDHRFWININEHQFKSLELRRHEDGMWHTNYTSTWLNRAYDFGADYIDSRHNDNVFRSQLRRAKYLGYKEYADNWNVYADFLVKRADDGSILNTSTGYFLIDYYEDDVDQLTHVSLNHALSLMNYLIASYQATGNEELLPTIKAHQNALEETADEWINDEGYLNYQLNLDGSYSGVDYNLVTYYDLLYSVELIEEIFPEDQTEHLEQLISAKEEQLIENDLFKYTDPSKIENYMGLIE
ncbi:hypothetical protein [Jeotgalibacillus campisalis]|uniref:D-glucuronyl C5-epimerase C-terminal domain-containing protein n=1 Tax=Jeotgalibacillus campisalis TaxID=220754 RepID=A0A0C2RMZ1_9BACL|nr:hypothetical protein [Jeotgalibacillus campisalis]KIL43139.1 hypothetical protein KR50_35420 [Jeotgalibacillus campisalis]